MTDWPLNEEDLKARILLPYLSALGISPGQVELEKTLRLKLGRNSIERDGSRQPTASGRLDVLVRSCIEQKNLFVVELKRPDADLTDDDRDQGISYARLLDQIAPFVLVTNGREATLYDTIKKTPLDEKSFPRQSAFWRHGCLLADSESLRIRYEALKHFVGYSVENVHAFSVSQQEQWLEAVRGDRTKLGRKYVPELYVPRQAVREAVDRFLAGTGAAFAVVGDSGVGKTNEMCALAERLSSDRIAIFITGAAVSNGMGATLLDEFNWHFSDQVSEADLVRRLAEIARATNKSAVVIVDALDEAAVPAFEQSVAAFARHLRDFSGQVKLIVSAKSAEWERFARFRGTPSPLLLSLDPSWHSGSSDSEEPGPMILTEFSEEELRQAEPKYRDVFRLDNTPSGRMRKHCHLPFFLRVASETYAGRAGGLPTDISASELVQAWLDGKYNSMANANRARLELLAVARAAWKRATTPQDNVPRTLAEIEAIPEADILAENGNGTTPIGDELVFHGVLTRHVDEHGRVTFSFYYGRIRDYLLARQALRLDQLSPDKFGEMVDTLLSSHLLQNVLSWHLQDAPRSHLAELKKALRGRAAVFLDTYEQLLDRMVPGVKEGVQPFTTGKIGFAYEITPNGPRSFGLYTLGPDDRERITVVEPAKDDPELWPFSRELRTVTRHARGGGKNFSNSDPEMAAAEFAYEQITEAIDEGRLDDMVSDDQIVEATLALSLAYRDKLGLRHGTLLSVLDPSLYPADIKSIDRSLQRYFGVEHYQRRWVDEQVAHGSRHVTQHGSTTRITFDPRAIEEIRRRVESELDQGMRFPKPAFVNEKEFYRLTLLLDRLQEKSLATVVSPLPLPDLPLSSYRDDELPNAYSDEQMANLIRQFFERSIKAYQLIVERNFPGLRSRFQTYARLPLSVIAEYRRPQREDEPSAVTQNRPLVVT